MWQSKKKKASRELFARVSSAHEMISGSPRDTGLLYRFYYGVADHHSTTDNVKFTLRRIDQMIERVEKDTACDINKYSQCIHELTNINYIEDDICERLLELLHIMRNTLL